MRKRMMIIAGALALSLVLAGCSPTQPAVDGREESKPNKTQQTSEGTSEEATKPEEKITESASNPEETSSDKEKPSEEEGFSVAIDAENFPDEAFRKVVSKYDQNGNGKLEEKEVKGIDSLELWDSDEWGIKKGYGITDLKGIEHFFDLEDLDCSGNQLTSLDVSGLSELKFLNCTGNQLTELDLSNNIKLMRLCCTSNRLTSLDLSSNSNLFEVYCEKNPLSQVSGDIFSNHGSTWKVSIDPNVELVGKDGHIRNLSDPVPEIDPETNATIYPDGLYITGACLEAEQMKEETGLGLASYEYDSLKVENGFLSFNGYLQSSCGDGHVKLPLSEELKDFYSNNAFDPEDFQLGMVIKFENGCVVAVEGCIDGL